MFSVGEAVAIGFGCLLTGGLAVWTFMRGELAATANERDGLLERVAERVVEESSGSKQ
jgi:hypothetical protein